MSTENFITQDSGNRVYFNSGMHRDTNKGKPRPDLLIPLGQTNDRHYEASFLWRFVMLLTRGAEKYDARNWEQAAGQEEMQRAKESAFRHFMLWYFGVRDEDHGAAVAFNIMVAEYVLWRQGQEQENAGAKRLQEQNDSSPYDPEAD
jgi:hypothetical protein